MLKGGATRSAERQAEVFRSSEGVVQGAESLTFRQNFICLGLAYALDRAQRLLWCKGDRFDSMQTGI